MKRVFRVALPAFLVVLLNVFAFGVHTAAFAASSGHSMAGMKHTSTSSSCVSLCTTAPIRKEDDIDRNIEEDEDEPLPPFYTLYQQPILSLAKQHSEGARYAVRIEPPPGLPAYIEYAVFRT